MSDFLKKQFGETCYMSCGFVGNQSANSFSELFQNFLNKFKYTYALRYCIIIVVGFFPLCLLFVYSTINSENKILIISKLKKIFTNFQKYYLKHELDLKPSFFHLKI